MKFEEILKWMGYNSIIALWFSVVLSDNEQSIDNILFDKF